MPTLQEILDNDLGLANSVQEKTAGENAPETDEIEKLAMEIGLVPDGTNFSTETTGQKKEAQMGLDNLYTQMFPGDESIVSTGTEKVAALDKEAAEIEEAMGALAFDHYHQCLDAHITKIAEELAGGVNISAEKADGTPPESMASNEAKGDKAINTKPEIQDQLMGDHPAGAVGDFEHKKAPHGELHKQAMRKAYLQSLVDAE